MRHIQIKILTVTAMILLSVSSYGQMQQVLRNGFVAATDDGVWYLQDGFSEWMRLETPYDLITSITFNKTELGVFGSNSSYTNGSPRIVYGDKLSYSWAYSSGQSNAISTNKFKKTHSQADAIKYNNGSLSSVHFSSGFGSYHWNYNDTNKDIWRTDIASDNDSIFIVSCKDNDLVKYTINYTTESVSNVFVSGLHSRPTDSHQICYNPDDDEFIIVSDSGIVYSYDKTTLTTLDTLDYSYRNSPLDRIKSLEYNNGQIMVIAISTDGKEDFAVHSLSNLTANDLFQSGYLSDQILYISKNKNRFVLFNFTPNEANFHVIRIIKLDGTGDEYFKSTSYMADKTIFDLDYINYIP